ncbi:MAG: VanW family protein [Candidatus Magasanikbacteria bacterium]|nr:VanW family protein [Candidatus Magasanikbacteria bacterium]
MEETVEKKVGGFRWSLWLVVLAFFLFVLFIAGFLALLVKLPENVVARGVTIGQIDLGGLTKEQAEKIITRQTDAVENQGVSFVYKDINLNLVSIKHSVTNPEISATIFDYDPEGTIKRALEMGRKGNNANQIITRLYLRLFGIKIDPVYDLSSEEASRFLKEGLFSYEESTQNAFLKVENGQILKVNVVGEVAGKSFDYSIALKDLQKRLNNLDSSDILLHFNNTTPEVTKAEAEKLVPVLMESLSKGEIILQSGQKEFVIKPLEWGNWVEVTKENKQVKLVVKEDLLKAYLQDKINPEIESEFEEAKFVVENGKVKEFKSGKEGQKINIELVFKAVQEALFNGGERKIQLVTEVVQPGLTLDKVNSFGIKELLGEGRTNFKGSPTNRRKNIAVGAAAFNGILIAPNEVVSTISKLKPIDDTNGYVPELVIKGNKTTPEFGGGLCQVSTTFFRAVLASGLPVLERAAHAYRVSYYEPPVGIDATIYDPAPDFKFVNDTVNYILVQTRIEGDVLIFEFWGTKDGRVIKRTDPVVNNFKSPPAPKLIETLTLPVGQKKCTEKAHAGADALFYYTVTYADGSIKNQEFKSRYKPWGEVCMIGVEKLSEPTVEGIFSASSTSSGGETLVPSIPPVPVTVSP